ncbi:MAG: hypothetical protein WCS01_15680, partial [bacterium]
SSLKGWDATGIQVLDVSFQTFQRNDMFLAEMKHFLACLEGAERPRVSAGEGARSLAMALAAQQSQITGKIERVAQLDT